MLKLKYYYLTSFILLVCTKLFCINESFNFYQIDSDDGLSQSYVNAICKDKHDFMWFGTYNGLNRYDGYSIKVYKNILKDSTSLSNNYINDIIIDKKDNLWVCTGRGICKYNPVEDNFTQYLNDNFIVEAVPLSNGNLIICTRNNGFALYQSNLDEILSLDISYEIAPDQTVQDAFEINENEILVATNKKEIYKYNLSDQSYSPFITSDKLPGRSNFKGIFKDSRGNLWIWGNQSGLAHINMQTLEVNNYTNFSGTQIRNHPVETSEGKILFPSEDEAGIIVYDLSKNKFNDPILKNTKIKGALPTSTIFSLFLEDNNRLWVGTFASGVCVHDPLRHKFKTTQNNPYESNSLNEGQVFSIFEDSKHRIWTGTTGGSLSYYSPKSGEYVHFKYLQNEKGLSSDDIYSINELPNGMIVAGTWAGGMNKINLKTGEVKHLKNDPNNINSIPSNHIFSIFRDTKNRIWVGSWDNGIALYNYKKDIFECIPETQGISIYVIKQDSTGTLWMGGQHHEVINYNPESKEIKKIQFNDENGRIIESLTTTDILFYNKFIWIATESNGLFCIDPTTYKTVNHHIQKSINGIIGLTSILGDNNNSLWLGTDQGLSQFNLNTKEFISYDILDGLQGNQFNIGSAYKTHDGTLYFGGNKGISHFHPDQIQYNPTPPQIVFTNFKLYNEEAIKINGGLGKKHINFISHIKLPYTHNMFTIEYAALNYTNSSKNQYQYKLDGFSDSWKHMNDKRSVTFTNLDPGTYTLKIKASNNDNVWNETGKELVIEIVPPFYKTWTFRILTSLVFIGIILLLLRYRINIVKKQKVILEQANERLNNEIIIKDLAIKERDITRYELQKTKNYIDNIINSMPSILIGIDINFKITHWNKQTEKSTRISAKEAINKDLTAIYPYILDELAKLKKAIKSKKVQQIHKKAIKKDNLIHYEDITIYPLTTNGVEGAVIRIDNITEKVRLEEIMVQSEKMMSVGGLAAGMAHEINNPLAGILQNSEVLVKRLTDNQLKTNVKIAEEIGFDFNLLKEYLNKRNLLTMISDIQKSGKRAADIVKNMLSFARKSDKQFSTHNIQELLDETLALIQTDYDIKKKYDFKQIKIIKEYQENVRSVPCESSKIQQVFFNLLKNAAEEMGEKGTFNNEPPQLILRISEAEQFIQVEIKDNGQGMDAETSKRIFEPFYTTKSIGKGTGLGLSVSYFIIKDNHRGEMFVETSKGAGAKFVIQLPFQ